VAAVTGHPDSVLISFRGVVVAVPSRSDGAAVDRSSSTVS